MAQVKKYKDANSWCHRMCFRVVIKPLVKDFLDKLVANRLQLVAKEEQLEIRLVKKKQCYGVFKCLEDGVNVVFTPKDFWQPEKLLEDLKSFLRPPEYQEYKPYDDYKAAYRISYKTIVERQDEFINILNRYRYAVGAL